MRHNTKFYIDGQWVDPVSPHLFEVVNPATEEAAGQISLGSSADVDGAVIAAKQAFPAYSQTKRKTGLRYCNGSSISTRSGSRSWRKR
jgi:aldehyde dehydrogenase (NAD+)